MSATKLISFFSMMERAPTNLADVRDQIKAIYDIDDIQFYPFNEAPDDLLGMLVRWSQKYVYGTITLHCAVCYNENMDPWFQRLICCKEMINIFDDPDGITKSREDVNGLLDGLLGKRAHFSITNIFDVQMFFDERAIGQAMTVLYPLPYLKNQKRDIERLLTTEQKVADKLRVPLDVAKFLLSQKWHEAATKIIEMSD